MNTDVLIIGAGPAGSVAAAYLIQNGYSVTVLEKTTFPRFVIGESLLPHCMDHLDEVGLLETVKDQKFQLKTGAAFYRGYETCRFAFSDQFTKGWCYTYQVKRADFDHCLIKEVERKGANVYFNSTVIAVEASEEIQKTTYIDSDGNQQVVQSRFLLDASGYGRVLPRLFNLDRPTQMPSRGALFVHIEDKNRTDSAAENIFIHAFNDNKAWIWAIPFSDGTASLGIVGGIDMIHDYQANDSAKFRDLITHFPALKERFANAKFIFEPTNLLNYSASVDEFFGPGYALCGNSTEFLDPIFSSGVTLAITSGLKAAKLVDKSLKDEHCDWKTDYADFMAQGIDVFRTFVNAWYKNELSAIFYSKEITHEFRCMICSILAGYVWDTTNPIVKKHKTAVTTLYKVASRADR